MNITFVQLKVNTQVGEIRQKQDKGKEPKIKYRLDTRELTRNV